MNLKKTSDHYLNKCYSQGGEDIVIDNIFSTKSKGYYVDVGAHHPYRFSNTFKFYEKGWEGINIDPLPNMKEKFDKERPRDFNLEIGISLKSGNLNYYMFSEPAINTFDEDIATAWLNNETLDHPAKLVDKKLIPVVRLETILDQHLPKNTEIDFLNIDVEGLDFEVLQSNNWGKYKPKLIACEIHKSIEEILDCEIYYYLVAKGYKFHAKTCLTSFFLRKD